MIQEDLFSNSFVTNGEETSTAAAMKVYNKTGEDRRRILLAIAARSESGLTDLELQQNLGLSGDSERPRRGELAKRGLIEEAGRRGGATVWKLTSKGQDAYKVEAS